MSVDLSKIKPGDEVTVRFVVHWAVNPNGMLAVIPGAAHVNHAGELVLNASAVVEHHPKALSVGDRVKMPGTWREVVFEVIGVSGQWAWLKDADEHHLQARLSELERIP